MKRFAFLATAAATLAIPASAMAANTGRGVVLSVHSQSIQVVNAKHLASVYSFHGNLSRLRLGDRVVFHVDGKSISGLHVLGATNTVSYFAHVVRSSSGKLVLALGDGSRVSFSAAQIEATKRHASHAPVAHAASGITLTVNTAPGTNVLVTEALGDDGNIAIAITITIEPSSSPSGRSGGSAGSAGSGGAASNDQTMVGVVTDVQIDSFGVINEDGTVAHISIDPGALANIDMSGCDTVIVSYHQGSGGLVADNVDDYGSSDAGSCVSDGTYYPAQEETGPITGLSTTSITIDTPDRGSMSFPLIASVELAVGYQLGDMVDVTYSQDPDGTLYVTDIEYVENDSTGVVQSVSQGGLTIIDDSSSQADTFIADPSLQLLQGVALGDEVDVSWHQAANGASVADSVSDFGPSNQS